MQDAIRRGGQSAKLKSKEQKNFCKYFLNKNFGTK